MFKPQEEQVSHFSSALQNVSFIDNYPISRPKHHENDEKIQINSQYDSNHKRQTSKNCDICGGIIFSNQKFNHYCYFEDDANIDDSMLNHYYGKLQDPVKLPEKIEDAQKKQLKKFQRSRISISRIMSDLEKDKVNTSIIPSKIKEIQHHPIAEQKVQDEEALEFIPCPFCAVPLDLNQLDHINDCQEGSECLYCKQKYPKSLYGSHLVICPQKESYRANKYKFNQRSSTQAKIQSKKIVKKQEEVKPKPSEKDKNSLVVQSKKKIFSKPANPINPAPKKYGSITYKREPLKKSFNQNKVVKKQQQMPAYDEFALNNASMLRQEELKGLYDWQIDQIRTEPYEKMGNDDGECSICTMHVDEGQLIMRLPCTHYFHEDCLRPWMKMRSRCPTCKTLIKQ